MSDQIRYVEIVRRYALWESVPDHLRITPDDVHRVDSWRGKLTTIGEEMLQLIEQPRCAVALQQVKYRNKYSPCARRVNAGDRCAVHGGPEALTTRRAKQPTRAELLAEIERLRKNA